MNTERIARRRRGPGSVALARGLAAGLAERWAAALAAAITARMAAVMAAALAVLSGGCAINPGTGNPTIVLSSVQGERKTGQEMHDKFLDEGQNYDDAELQAYVEKIGQRLVAHSDKPDLKFTFTVLDAPGINAFATPGGFIYVNRGLLAYLNSEAELAGVLGHEIAHVTARHHARRKTAGVTGKVLSGAAYVLTRSRAVYAASNMYGAELISGYGRDMELEADGLGAKYMYRAGYEPEALLDVIGVLKNQEQFMRVKARAAGKTGATYHGVYATHPRNDKRLRTVIRAAGTLDEGAYIESPEIPGEFRRVTDGVVWGESVGQRAEDRYYHNRLGFTFAPPEGWAVTASARAVVAAAADASAQLSVTLRRKNPDATPRAILEGSVRGELRAQQPLQGDGLKGYTAIATANGTSKRVAAIDLDPFTYLFEGEARDFAARDAQLLAIIQSFRAVHPREKSAAGGGRYVRYIQAPRGADMASLAARAGVADAESYLRLINDFYPRGEPRTGDWIKVIQY